MGSNNELAARRVREILIRDTSDAFSAWLMALFSPWASVPARPKGQKDKKEPPPRVVEISKEGIKADNKTVSILRDAAENYNSVIELKSTFLGKKISGTAKDIRQHVGLALRSWKKDWRMCVLMGFLQEVMAGKNSSTGKD
jgi:tRNA nucleotidyltransferase (CCA-adding enzyme)